MRWRTTVTIKDLFTEDEDYDTLAATMEAIAEVLDASPCFKGFDTSKFYVLPRGDETFKPIDYANRYLDEMYDYADSHAIWLD